MICELKWRKIPTEDLKIAEYSIFIRFSIVMVGYSGTFLFALFLFLFFWECRANAAFEHQFVAI